MGKASRYLNGVKKEAKRVRWPKKEEFIPTIITVLVIAIFTAVFLLIEDLAAGTLLQQLREAFKGLRG